MPSLYRSQDAKRAVEAAGGKWDGDKVRPIVPLAACFEAFAESETVPDFFSTATGQRGTRRTAACGLGQCA